MMALNTIMTMIFMIEKTTKMELSWKPLEIMRKKNTAIFIDDKREMIKKNAYQSARPNIFKYDER